MTRTEELVAELKLDSDEETQKQAWIDFVKKHHLALVWQANPQGAIIPYALRVEEDPFSFDDAVKAQEAGLLDGTEYTEQDDLSETLAKIGLKTIDDMPGLDKSYYVDTPANRKVCAEALRTHPEKYAMTEYVFEKTVLDALPQHIREQIHNIVVDLDDSGTRRRITCYLYPNKGCTMFQKEENITYEDNKYVPAGYFVKLDFGVTYDDFVLPDQSIHMKKMQEVAVQLAKELQSHYADAAQNKNQGIHFYEVAFAEPGTTWEDIQDGADAYFVAIRGTKPPTPEEAKDFLYRDFFTGENALHKDWLCMHVQEIPKDEVLEFYTDSEERANSWRLFTGGKSTENVESLADEQSVYTYHLKVRLSAQEEHYSVSPEEQALCHGNAFLAAGKIVDDVLKESDYGELQNVFASGFRTEESRLGFPRDHMPITFDVNGYVERDVTLTEPLRQDMLQDTEEGWGYGVEEYGLSSENEQVMKDAMKDIDFGEGINTFNDLLHADAEAFRGSPYPFDVRIVGAELVRERKQEIPSNQKQMAEAKEAVKQAAKAYYDACQQNGILLSAANKDMLAILREVSDKEKDMARA